MEGKLRFKFSTKDVWGKLRYYTKTIKITIPTDEHGFILMNECINIADETVKEVPNFYKILWVSSPL